MFKKSLIKGAWYCPLNFALACGQAGNGGGATEMPPDDGPSLVADTSYRGRSLYAFSDTEDTMPSLVVLSNAAGGRFECSLIFPGNTPMTGVDNPIECSAVGPGLIVTASYPPTSLPPRTQESPTEPPEPPPAATGACDSDACVGGPAIGNSAPPFPYVYFDIRVNTEETHLELSITGNGRDVSAAVPLTVDTWQAAYYFNVDEAPAP